MSWDPDHTPSANAESYPSFQTNANPDSTIAKNLNQDGFSPGYWGPTTYTIIVLTY